MFIRNPWTTDTVQHAGPFNSVGRRGLGAVPGASDQALLRELHGLAMSIYQAQQDIIAAQQRGDAAYAVARTQDVTRLREIFTSTAEQFQGNDLDALSLFTQFADRVRDWEDGVKDWVANGGISDVLAFIPTQLLDLLEKLGKKAAGTALDIGLPIILVGAGLIALLIFGVGKAERTRTYKRYVA